jgi:hypothetical protein
VTDDTDVGQAGCEHGAASSDLRSSSHPSDEAIGAGRTTQHGAVIAGLGVRGWRCGRFAYAAQIIANPRQLLAVTIYSSKSLDIYVPGVIETELANADSAYRYRYECLRLVQRSGDRYLLMSEQANAQTSRIIVLRETDTIRMEFSR